MLGRDGANVWWNMLVVRVSACQRWVVRMRKGVVPVKYLLVGIRGPAVFVCCRRALPFKRVAWARDLVAVALDNIQFEIQELLDAENDIICEKDAPLYAAEQDPDAI